MVSLPLDALLSTPTFKDLLKDSFPSPWGAYEKHVWYPFVFLDIIVRPNYTPLLSTLVVLFILIYVLSCAIVALLLLCIFCKKKKLPDHSKQPDSHKDHENLKVVHRSRTEIPQIIKKKFSIRWKLVIINFSLLNH